jgi:ribosomal protein S18 acetylase RimI-like enzyme
MDIQIRPYQAYDQLAVFRIAADTAFFGEPVEEFMEDRSLFCDAFVRYYTTLEAWYCWVANSEVGVIGYLLGCADSSLLIGKWIRNILPWLVGSILRGRYKIGKRTLKYTLGMVSGYLHKEEPDVSLAVYPAHLHVNVQDGSRGTGVGRRLLEAYLGQLRQQGVEGVYLGTTNLNQAACHLYEKIGFSLLGARNNRFWTRRLGRWVENRRYGLKFT